MEPFYIFAVLNYYETPDHDYVPAEVTMVEFSLMRGITKQYNTVLKLIHIPEQYRSAIGKKVSNTHKIFPDCPPLGARNDYRAVVDEMKSFYGCNKQANQFRAFVLSKQFNSAQGAIKELRNVTGSKCFISHEKVCCVEDLFTLLCNFQHCDPKRLELAGFTNLLVESNWDYEPRTLCPFHNHVQSKYCASAIAKKVCYYLFEHVINIYPLSLTENHLPPCCTSAKFRNPNLQMQQYQRANERAISAQITVEKFATNEMLPIASSVPTLSPPVGSFSMSHHFSAFDAPFAPAFSRPETDIALNAIHRPTTKSICSRKSVRETNEIDRQSSFESKNVIKLM